MASSDNTDRQSLLEQKRQRLQELKLRRAIAAPDSAEVDVLVERLVAPKVGVSVGIQTEPAPVGQGARSNVESDSGSGVGGRGQAPAGGSPGVARITFEKGVQAGDAPEHSTTLQSGTNDTNGTNAGTNAGTDTGVSAGDEEAPVDEDSLNSAMSKSLKTLNRLLLGASAEPHNLGDAGTNWATRHSELSAFTVTQTVGVGGDVTVEPVRDCRRVVAVDVAAHTPLCVVSYGPQTWFLQPLQQHQHQQSQQQSQHLKQQQQLQLQQLQQKQVSGANIVEASAAKSPGLAIVYNLSGSTPVPEVYLVAVTEITSIRFDSSTTSTKLVGGLSNGRVAIWEVKEDSMVLLPLLVSPIMSSNAVSASRTLDEKNLVNHGRPVSQILQEPSVVSSSPFVTMSLDGVVNYWSTSILATPKADSVQLCKPQASEFSNLNMKENVAITSLVLLEQQAGRGGSSSTVGAGSSTAVETHSFLNNLVVGTQSGQLYKLCGQKPFIELKSTHHGVPVSPVNSMAEIGHTRDAAIVVSEGMDCGFNIWSVGSLAITHRLFVHVDHVVTRVVARSSQHQYQFVTLGIVSADGASSTLVVSFWNLKERLMNPILYVSVPEELSAQIVTTAHFSPLGDRLFVGFSNGKVLVWSIDDTVLDKTALAHKKEKIDNGIEGMF